MIASYVLLGLSITLLSLFGGRYIHQESVGRTSYRGNLLERTSEIASIANSASEEGFSFVITGDPNERESSLAKLATATGNLQQLAGDPQLAEEEHRLFASAVSALQAQTTAASEFFDAYSDTGAVVRGRYDRYEAALDGQASKLIELRDYLRSQNVKDRAAVAQVSARLTLLIGFAAMLIAAAVGGAFARHVTRPMLMLRDAAVAIGAGRLDVPFPPLSRDEIGDLTSAFRRMTEDVRDHLATIQTGQQLLEDVFASIEDLVVVCDGDGVIVMANPACCLAAGRSAEELHGKPATTLFGALARGWVTNEASVMHELDATLRAIDGREVAVRLSVSRLRGRDRTGGSASLRT